METHEVGVKNFLREHRYFRGRIDDVIILSNDAAIALDENDDFAKYSLVTLNKKSGNYRKETYVSNFILSMLALSIVIDKVEYKKEEMYGFLERLLETGYNPGNDKEIANELRSYDGDLLEFLLKKSRVVNEKNYDIYNEIVERVLQ